MGSSTADSAGEAGSRPWLSGLAVAVVFVLLASQAVLGVTSLVDPTLAAVALVALAGLTVGALWRRAARSADGDSDVWNAIPSRQYEGRHAESGGLTRSEQESALRDIQQQADELEEQQ